MTNHVTYFCDRLTELAFQFVGGGWTQNDEAVTHYSAILDNLSLGMKFIADNFGNFEHFF